MKVGNDMDKNNDNNSTSQTPVPTGKGPAREPRRETVVIAPIDAPSDRLPRPTRLEDLPPVKPFPFIT